MTEGPSTDPRTVWGASLDALELDLVETERALLLESAADVVPEVRPTWQAPAVPLPAELAPRAAALLARHQDLTARVERAMAGIRREQRRSTQLHARLDLGTAPPPVYVDRAV
ncbi:hypothetical protein FHN55_03455 [Streptomyces sp. NP160]|uniref:hypothetical protein n=1 Tax=Streptomyces sp. NP160 TaxID=2586637 RepID=UPI0011185E41|nr:hypothetical protein [Streptomyces sp. NP160]TNM69383.1 hypothetical protein FHN55_03455 [Streptomyces sp. NP160]